MSEKSDQTIHAAADELGQAFYVITKTDEAGTWMDSRVDTSVTPALKRVLERVASNRMISRSDVIRQALMEGLPVLYPEFESYYREEKDHDKPATS